MTDTADPKGLIRESYRIDGITDGECRSIFFDWALSLPVDSDEFAFIGELLDRYGNDHPDHPMTAVLTQGQTAAQTPPKRRGGRRGR